MLSEDSAVPRENQDAVNRRLNLYKRNNLDRHVLDTFFGLLIIIWEPLNPRFLPENFRCNYRYYRYLGVLPKTSRPTLSPDCWTYCQHQKRYSSKDRHLEHRTSRNITRTRSPSQQRPPGKRESEAIMSKFWTPHPRKAGNVATSLNLGCFSQTIF